MNALERKRELLDAVRKGDLLLLKTLLRDGGNLNSIYENGKTLLIVAIQEQKKEIVESLIHAGAQLDQRDFYDRTPLMYAADNADATIARVLLDAGADVNAHNWQGRTALMHAAYSSSVEMVKTLLNAGADKNARDFKNRSAWNYSLLGKTDAARSLLESEATSRSGAERNGCLALLSAFLPLDFAAQLKQASENHDDFTELMNAPKWSWPAVFASYSLMITLGFLLILFDVFVYSCGIIFSVLFILGVAWRVFVTFPSTWKIWPLGRQIMERISQRGGERLVNVPAAHNVQSQSDIEFVSRLMELGSRELSFIQHPVQPHRQRLPVLIEMFFSRGMSFLLALSIPALFSILFLSSGTFISTSEDGLSDLCISVGFVLPPWIWVAHRLEYQLRRQRLRIIQRDRDQRAGEISRVLVHQAEEYANKELPYDFGLYLRAFMTTDRLRIDGLDLETLLAYSIAPTLPLIALGKPGEHLGSGRIQTSNEYWKEEILRLMDAARLILIIPSHRPGTLWEISTLRDLGYLDKTIFIMPPEMEFNRGKYSDDWKKTVAAAVEVRVEFPQHIPSGVLFRLGRGGEFERFAPLLSEEFRLEIQAIANTLEARSWTAPEEANGDDGQEEADDLAADSIDHDHHDAEASVVASDGHHDDGAGSGAS